MALLKQEQEYQPFLKYSDDVSDPASSIEPSHSKLNRRATKYLPHFLILIITSLIWIAILFTSSHFPSKWKLPSDPPQNITSGMRYIDCGTTLPEAHSRGCIYDLLLLHWLPAPCYDDFNDHWIAAYQADNSWHGYAHQNLTGLLTVEEMSTAVPGSGRIFWTSWRDHVVHCSLIWQRQFHALFEVRKAIDSRMVTQAHVDHCVMMFMLPEEKRKQEERDNTPNEARFGGCWVRD